MTSRRPSLHAVPTDSPLELREPAMERRSMPSPSAATSLRPQRDTAMRGRHRSGRPRRPIPPARTGLRRPRCRRPPSKGPASPEMRRERALHERSDAGTMTAAPTIGVPRRARGPWNGKNSRRFIAKRCERCRRRGIGTSGRCAGLANRMIRAPIRPDHAERVPIHVGFGSLRSSSGAEIQNPNSNSEVARPTGVEPVFAT